MYGEGISKTGEILDLAVEFEIIKKTGSGSYGETKLGQGRDAVKSLIKDNPELADELEIKIKARIKELTHKTKKLAMANSFSLFCKHRFSLLIDSQSD
jgi:hypothetical protein